MQIGIPQKSGILPYLLQFASQPSTQPADFLDAVLEIALRETASDAGWIVADTMPFHAEPALAIKSVKGPPEARRSELLQHWHQLIDCRAPRSWEGNAAPEEVMRNPASTLRFLIKGSCSALSASLTEGKKLVGLLHVESLQPSNYSEQRRVGLERLVSAAVPALQRLLLKEQMRKAGAPVEIIGVSPVFLDLERQIKLAAEYDFGPVLITGDRGSGKELTAWALHCWSARRNFQFVPVLASSFTDGLFADELFGHERYAFTGAAQERLGKFKAADRGTIFLDEVADMPEIVQSALLRIVERGEVPRIGRDLPQKVNVRIISATNRNLQELIERGKFRHDLYDRLRVFEIHVPPLRERRDDIPLLIDHFIRKYCEEVHRHIRFQDSSLCSDCRESHRVSCISAPVYTMLAQLDWPGNVRELKNSVLRLLTSAPEQTLQPCHLPLEIQRQQQRAARSSNDLALDGAIRKHIELVLRIANHNQSEAARLLGTPLSTLRSKMKKLGLKRIGP